MNLQRTMNTGGVPYCEDPQVPRPATYTYISLELGQLWISLTRKRWAHTRHSYHVTIAYLPGMAPLLRRNIHTDLTNMLDAWRWSRSAPLTRIRNLDILWRRHASFTRERSQYELDESVVLTDMTLDQIQDDMAKHKMIDFIL